jgi:hypothetical protein
VILKKQIDAARQKIKDAAEAVRQAEAARVLLEKSPTGDFAQKLRDAVDVVKVREAEKADAEKDLLELEKASVSPPLFVAAARAIQFCFSGLTGNLAYSLSEGLSDANDAKLAEAVEHVEGVICAAIEMWLVPELERLAIRRRAFKLSGSDAQRAMESEILLELLGQPPAGVCRPGRYFEEANKPKAPPAPPEISPILHRLPPPPPAPATPAVPATPPAPTTIGQRIRGFLVKPPTRHLKAVHNKDDAARRE